MPASVSPCDRALSSVETWRRDDEKTACTSDRTGLVPAAERLRRGQTARRGRRRCSMTDLRVTRPWFRRSRIDAITTLITEPHVHPLLRCNIWHVRGHQRDLLVDTGLGVTSLAAAGHDLFADNLIVVATHAHTDHVGSFHEFTHREIHAAEAEAVASIGGTLSLDVTDTDEEEFGLLASWGYDIRGGLLTAVPTDDFDLDGHPRQPAAPTQVLEEGDVIDLGDRVYEVLHVPGHSPGSIALWDRVDRVLFSGDAVYDGALLDEIDGADIDLYVDSMRRLHALPVTVVHGGHGPSMDPIRFRTVIRAYLDERA